MSNSTSNLSIKAIEAALQSGELEDLERAASICKLVAEAEGSEAAASTRKSELRHEAVKQLAQLLVPFLSVLTLGVTLMTQSQQQKEAERNHQDSVWLATINDIKAASTNQNPAGGLVAQVKLKPFLQSPIYSEQANQLARLILPNLGDPSAFEDLFDSVKWHSLGELINIDRGLNRHFDELDQRLEELSTAPTGNHQQVSDGRSHPTTAAQYSRGTPEPPESVVDVRARLEHDRSNLLKQITYVCDKIGEASRKNLFDPESINLTETLFIDCDLSSVNFNGARISATKWQNVSLEGAHLNRLKNPGGLVLWDTEWWKAAEIDAAVLQNLIDNDYPGSDSEKDLTPPRREDYVKRVVELCKKASLPCSESSLKFASPSGIGT